MKKLFIPCISFLLFYCIGCTEIPEDEELSLISNGIFPSGSLLFCSVPVPASVSSQSQTHPSICYIRNKWNGYDHWLASTPYPHGNSREENPCIYFANSGSDDPPLNFTGININPILKPPDAGYNSDVELFFTNNCLYSLIRVCGINPDTREIKVQKSSNGFDWSPAIHIYSDTDCKGKDELSPSIIPYTDKLRIYHLNGDVNTNRHGTCSSIEIMEGTNLDNPDFKWLKFGHFTNKASVKIEPWHMDLFEYNNKLYMVFCGRDRTEGKHRLHIYLAVSDDYENFTIFPEPLIKDLYIFMPIVSIDGASYANFEVTLGPEIEKFDTYRPTAYVDENGFFNIYFSVIGHNRMDNSDRSVGFARMKMDELLSGLNQ